MARQYSSMSAETIYVNVIYSDRLDFASIPRISTEHLAVILEENPYLEGIYLRTTLFQETRIGQKKKDLTIAAVTWTCSGADSSRSCGAFLSAAYTHPATTTISPADRPLVTSLVRPSEKPVLI